MCDHRSWVAIFHRGIPKNNPNIGMFNEYGIKATPHQNRHHRRSAGLMGDVSSRKKQKRFLKREGGEGRVSCAAHRRFGVRFG